MELKTLNNTNNFTKENFNNKNTKDLAIIVKGSIIALILTIIMLTIYAVILAYTDVSENSMSMIITTICGLSILIGSSLSNIKIKRKGIINGGLIGLIYILVLYIISSIATGIFNLNFNSVILIIVSIATGMCGGIIGVNMK